MSAQTVKCGGLFPFTMEQDTICSKSPVYEYFRTISIYAVDAFSNNFFGGGGGGEERSLLHAYNMATYMNIRDCREREKFEQTECEIQHDNLFKIIDSLLANQTFPFLFRIPIPSFAYPLVRMNKFSQSRDGSQFD